LEKGDKGKVTVMFRGREIVHPEVGREMLNRVIQALGEDALVEQNPRLEGRQMVMIVAPGRGGSKKAA
jgi:translation initiation factor IF-3